jgi:LacI family transcriptional regulator
MPPVPRISKTRKQKGGRNVLLALNWYDSRIHKGVLNWAVNAGWHLNADMSHSQSLLPKNWHGDGVISMIPLERSPRRTDYLNLLRKAGAQCVAINPHPDRRHLPHVRYDNHAIGRLAADPFLERGFRHFVFYGDKEDRWYSTERREAFKGRLAESGFPCTMFRRRSLEEVDWPEQLDDCVRMLRASPRPLAVWALSDNEASQVLEACRAADLAVPEEVAVLGAENDLMIAPHTTPALSSVDSNLETLGYEAARLLQSHMDGKSQSETAVIVPPKGLVARGSTDTLAAVHDGVRRFVDFVRRHYHEDLNHEDFCCASGMSSTALFNACKKDLGRNPGDILRWQRLKAAEARMLSTNDKLSAIALESGFKNGVTFWNAFQRAYGLSPEEWRNRNRKDHVPKPGA